MLKFNFMKYYLFVAGICVLLFAGSCGATKGKQGSLEELQSLMTGTFDSGAQADSDSSYYNIALNMYPIWTDRAGKWLYVEQALYSGQDKPYRQRVYGLEKGKKGTFISRVYELPDADAMIGAYSMPAKFDGINLSDLKEREGCAVILTRDKDGTYRGSTNQKDCKSTLRGANYATSRVSINKVFVQSWDQGYNTDDEQVWGATEGGYLFLKKN